MRKWLSEWFFYLDVAILIVIGAGLTLVPAYFTTLIQNAFTIEKVTIFRACFWLLLALTSIRWAFFAKKEYWPKMLWVLLGIGLWGIVSTVLSIAPTVSFWGIHLRMDGLNNLLYLVFWSVMVYLNIDTKNKLKGMVMATAIASLIPIGYALMQRWGMDPIGWKNMSSSAERVFGTLGNPAYLGAYLMFVMPITFYFLYSAYEGWKKIGWGALLVAQIMVLFYTLTRGAFIGLAVELVVILIGYAIIKSNKKLLTTSLITVLVLVSFVLVLNLVPSIAKSFGDNRYLNRLSMITQADTGTGKDRLEMWKIAIKAIGERPIYGSGLTTYHYYFNKYYPNYMDARSETDRYSNYSHNLFLDNSVAHGLVGSVLIIFFMIGSVVVGLRISKDMEEDDRILVLALGGGIIGYLTQAMFNIETIITWLYSYTWPALILAGVYLAKRGEENWNREASVTRQIGATLAVIVCLGGVWFLAINPAQADKLYLYADNLKITAEEKMKMIEQAESYTPYFEFSQVKIADAYLNQISGKTNEEANALYAKAEEYLKRSIAINPINFKDQYSLAQLYSSWSKSSPEKWNLAEEALKKCVEMSPNRLSILWGWGDMLIERGDLNGAQSKYNQAIKLNDQIGESYAHLAKSDYFSAGESASQEDLNKAGKLGYAFDEGQIYRDICEIAWNLGEKQKAVKACAKGNESKPSERTALIEIQSNIDLSQTAVAQQLAEKYLKVLPNLKDKLKMKSK